MVNSLFCKDWLRKDWEVMIDHIPRDSSVIADWLAKVATKRNCDWIEFHSPEIIRDILEIDKAKLAFMQDS